MKPRWKTLSRARTGATLVVTLVCLLLPCSPAGAQGGEISTSETPQQTSAAGTASPANEQDEILKGKSRRLRDKLQIHGFLNQAYAESELARGGFQSPTDDEIALGVPEGGTTGHRALALQFNLELTQRDKLVLQLSHQRLGDSPVNQVTDDVEVDWAFYEHRIRERSYVKVGRILIPNGIFNEIRDVGTLLPFYRPPTTFYRDDGFATETVDGVMVGHSFDVAAHWYLNLDVHYGEFDLVELPVVALPGSNVAPVAASAEDAVGAHLWVETPIAGLRFGGGARAYHPTGGLFELPGTRTDWWGWNASLEAVLQRFVFRAEYSRLFPEANTFPGLGVPIAGEDHGRNYYFQIGFHPSERWRIYFQHEYQETVDRTIEGFARPFSFTLYEGNALAVNYVTKHAVFKLEHHLIDLGTFAVAGVVPQPFGPPLLEPATKTAKDGRQTILSLAVSF